MQTPESFAARLAEFPATLHELIEAEVAAGNQIDEIASCFPAPPAGAYVKLARSVSTRARVKTAALDFYERNSSLWSGEWTDATRFYFVLEPPKPSPAEPDMDAIRDARNAAAAAAASAAIDGERRAVRVSADETVCRFVDSMKIDYEKWHDGIGYDLETLAKATPGERQQIETILLARGARDWRDIEALAALKTSKSQPALRAALETGGAEIRGAVLRYAPELVSEAEKTAHLIDALRTATFYAGLTQALDHVAEFHPPEVVAELFRGTLAREGEVAVSFAGLLMFIHGKAPERFDWSQRPFFLRFATANRLEREAAFRDLCEDIGVDAGEYLPPC